jgi:hypothetical protein
MSDAPSSMRPPLTQLFASCRPGSPSTYQRDPVQTTNTQLTASYMWGLAKRLSCKIFKASTSEVSAEALDDSLYALQSTIPHRTRSSLQRLRLQPPAGGPGLQFLYPGENDGVGLREALLRRWTGSP